MTTTDPRRVTEAQLQDAVIDTARLYGYRVAHFRPARVKDDPETGKARYVTPVAADGAGFPDLVLAGRRGIVVAELKSDRGTPTDDQFAWIAAFRAAGVPTYVWRPEDWRAGRIDRALQAGST